MIKHNPYDIAGAKERVQIKRKLRLAGHRIPAGINYDTEALRKMAKERNVAV